MYVPASAISADDIAHWPYTTGLLVIWVAFFGTLHWPACDLDLGVGGISFVELLILYELWAGERLSLEKSRMRVVRSTGFVVLDQDGKEFDSLVQLFSLGHVCGRDCAMLVIFLMSFLFVRGGEMTRMMGDMLLCSVQDWGEIIPGFCAGPRLEVCTFLISW